MRRVGTVLIIMTLLFNISITAFSDGMIEFDTSLTQKADRALDFSEDFSSSAYSRALLALTLMVDFAYENETEGDYFSNYLLDGYFSQFGDENDPKYYVMIFQDGNLLILSYKPKYAQGYYTVVNDVSEDEFDSLLDKYGYYCFIDETSLNKAVEDLTQFISSYSADNQANNSTSDSTVSDTSSLQKYANAYPWTCSECGQKENSSLYCINCGSQSPYWFCDNCDEICGGNFCPNCRTQSPYYENNKNSNTTPKPEPTPAKTLYKVELKKNERKVGGKFKETSTDYNVFSREIENCVGITFKYTASGGKGTRDVYVRSKTDEDCENDYGWTYVGQFEYNKLNTSTTVDLVFSERDVYAVAVVREELSSVSFTASWGDSVDFYYYRYN